MTRYIDGCRAKQANLINYTGYGPDNPVPSYSGADLEFLRLSSFEVIDYVTSYFGSVSRLSAADKIVGIERFRYSEIFGEDIDYVDGVFAAQQLLKYLGGYGTNLQEFYFCTGADFILNYFNNNAYGPSRSGADNQYFLDIDQAGL